MPSPYDEAMARLPESAWTLFERTEDYDRSFAVLTVGGEHKPVYRTQYRADEMLQKANTQEYNDSEGKRWGDGKVVARLPLNVIFDGKNQLAEKIREGDRDHMKYWLNSEAARPFRTFKGRV
mgnify:CR=1 FL=1